MATLFLLPTTLGEDCELDSVLPENERRVVERLEHFIVEDVRSARRFIRLLCRDKDLNTPTFYEINDHIPREVFASYLLPLQRGEDMGVLSEAGCPAVADPGGEIVALAHEKGLQVKPLVGPSSILLSLMASGFNGQNFAFNGYLPIEASQRRKKIKELEERAYREGQTQIFIETPYRNQSLFEELLRTLRPYTKLSIAENLTCKGETLSTRSVGEWGKNRKVFSKVPTIFLIYK